MNFDQLLGTVNTQKLVETKFQTVCVLAPTDQLVIMQVLDIENIQMVICIFAEIFFCQLTPVYADQAKAVMVNVLTSFWVSAAPKSWSKYTTVKV